MTPENQRKISHYIKMQVRRPIRVWKANVGEDVDTQVYLAVVLLRTEIRNVIKADYKILPNRLNI